MPGNWSALIAGGFKKLTNGTGSAFSHFLICSSPSHYLPTPALPDAFLSIFFFNSTYPPTHPPTQRLSLYLFLFISLFTLRPHSIYSALHLFIQPPPPVLPNTFLSISFRTQLTFQ